MILAFLGIFQITVIFSSFLFFGKVFFQNNSFFFITNFRQFFLEIIHKTKSILLDGNINKKINFFFTFIALVFNFIFFMSISKTQCQPPQPIFQDNWVYVDPIPTLYLNLLDPAFLEYQSVLDHIKTLYQHEQSEYTFIKINIEQTEFGFLINSLQTNLDTLKLSLNSLQTSYNNVVLNLLKASCGQPNALDFVLQSNNLHNSSCSFIKNTSLLIPKMLKEHQLALQVLFQIQDLAAIQEVMAPGIEYGKSKMEFTTNALRDFMSSFDTRGGTANSCIDLTGSDIGDRTALRDAIKDLLNDQQVKNCLETMPK